MISHFSLLSSSTLKSHVISFALRGLWFSTNYKSLNYRIPVQRAYWTTNLAEVQRILHLSLVPITQLKK